MLPSLAHQNPPASLLPNGTLLLRHSILLQMTVLWSLDIQMESNGTSLKHLNVELTVDAVVSSPEAPTFRTEAFILPAARSVDKWQCLPTLSLSKALPCLHPGPRPLPEHNPIQGRVVLSGRGLFSLHSGPFCTRTSWRMGQALCWTVSTASSAPPCSLLSSTRIYSEKFSQ